MRYVVEKAQAGPRGSGFTLVELLVVIVVLAILAAIVLPKFVDSSQRSKESSLRSNLRLLRDALQRFYNDTGSYPAQLADLAGKSAPAAGVTPTGGAAAVNASSWSGPYLNEVPDDPVSGLPFDYKTSGAGVGTLCSSATGVRALDGTLYTSW